MPLKEKFNVTTHSSPTKGRHSTLCETMGEAPVLVRRQKGVRGTIFIGVSTGKTQQGRKTV